MGLFDKVYCSCCGQAAKTLTRAKLNDGNYLCSECLKKVPSFIKDTLYKHYDIADYHALMNYIEHSNSKL